MDTEIDITKQLDLLIEKGVSFALYRLPWKTDPEFKMQTKGEVKCLYDIRQLNGETGFVMAPFKCNKEHPILVIKPNIKAVGWEKITAKIAKTALPKRKPALPESLFRPEQAVPDEKIHIQYEEDFNTFIHAIRENQFKKLVLSRTHWKKKTKKFHPLEAFRHACDCYPRAFVYLCYTPLTGVWMGSTPEIILSGDVKRWRTVALAGTMPMEDGQIPRLWSSKNRKEHTLVADYIRKQLRKIEIDPVEDGPYTIQAGHLTHLRSDFCFNLEDHHCLGDLLHMLHPTPAVCGLPKKKACHFIDRNESTDRKYYAGFVGWLEPEKRTELYVNLRCMRIDKKTFTLYAGSGLMPDSQLESEWRETEEKLKTMKLLID